VANRNLGLFAKLKTAALGSVSERPRRFENIYVLLFIAQRNFMRLILDTLPPTDFDDLQELNRPD